MGRRFARTPQAIREALRARPFEPFRLVLTDGQAYETRHPDQVRVGASYLIVGYQAAKDDPTLFERSDKVALLHVVRLESLPTATAANN